MPGQTTPFSVPGQEVQPVTPSRSCRPDGHSGAGRTRLVPAASPTRGNPTAGNGWRSAASRSDHTRSLVKHRVDLGE